MSNVKFSQLEDTSANIEASKRPLLMGFDTTVKEIFYVDSAEDKYTAVTKDASGVVPSLEVSELTSNGNAVLTSVSVDGTTIDGNGTVSDPLALAGSRTSGKILKADANGLPVDSIVSESGTEITISGSLGIGTTPSASAKLDIVSTGGTNVRIGGTALGDYGRILFHGNRVGSENTIGSVMAYNNQSGSAVLVSEIRQMHYGSSADNRSSMQLSTHDGTNLVTAMYVDATQKIGLGTTTPAEKLDVSGNIKVQRASAATSGTPVISSNRIRLHASRYNSGTPTDAGMGFRHSYFSDAANKNHLEITSSIDTVIGVIMNSGKMHVGGTTEPIEYLEVNGNAKAHSLIGSRKLYAAEAPNSYYGINEDLEIETDDVDDYIDIALPANTAIAHIIVDVVVQHGSGTSLDYTAILDTWVRVGNDKVETTVRCANQTSQPWLAIDETLASGKVRIRLDGGTSGATDSRIANVRGQIVEYLEIAS